ncbi:MAG: methyltransferase [Megasphaera sp.]|jgi:tRNA1(Val) A37 N6-methylase TrmN6|nr:methyltransferase [Megasphaera sp.]MCH4188288.1 methyltransferase [Megasphaera sp.]MCH4218413.1 methyltransferase [Megasphaera sp.]
MNIDLKSHERLDDLILDGMKLIQRDDQFCFSVDTVLLAQFGTMCHGPILDLGTGTAAIPLILTARGATAVTAVELNPVMADIARRNVKLNNRGAAVQVIEADYRHMAAWAASGSFDMVYANPPYREKSRGATSEVQGIRRARHEETATLEDVMAAAQYALKYHGRFRMVHITERLTDILESMRTHGIEPKIIRLIYGHSHARAKIFLVEGIRGGNPGVDVLPPLIIHEADGRYSQEVLAMYGKDI